MKIINYVLGEFNIWDEEDLQRRGLTGKAHALVAGCLKVMEGKTPTAAEKKMIRAVVAKKGRELDKERRAKIKIK